MKRSAIYTLLFIIFLHYNNQGLAQRNEKQLYRDYITINSFFTREPAHFRITVSGNSNVIIQSGDTASYNVNCFIRGEHSYLQTDGMEQLINDSISLFIHHASRRMVCRPINEKIQKPMNAMMGIGHNRKGIESLMKKYTINAEGETIGLNSKEFLKGTTLSRESIVLEFDKKNNSPVSTTIMNRTLVPASSEDSVFLHQLYGNGLKWVALEGMGSFFIRETTKTYDITILQQGGLVQMPASLDSWLKKQDNVFTPVKGYEDYSIINY